MARIGVGDKAPDFTLPAQSGEQVRLGDRLGERVVVLDFYPKDNTPGCTAEACAFRDSHEVFTYSKTNESSRSKKKESTDCAQSRHTRLDGSEARKE